MSVFHVSTLEFLSKTYPPTLSVEQVSEITSEQPQTIRNLISQGRYRVPSFKIGRKRVFRLVDVAEYIDQQLLADPSHPSRRKPRRGRPTKVEQLARRAGATHSRPPAMGA
ncbi:helix-turn-helix domain-containing protein [Cupriavidus pauculus]